MINSKHDKKFLIKKISEQPSNFVQYQIPTEITDQRLDSACAALIENIPSRSFATKLIDLGHIKVNGHLQKNSYKVCFNDQITIDLSVMVSQTEIPEAENIPLQVLFEDDDILVINKPAGLIVHPGAGVHSGTLVNAVLWHCKKSLPSLGEQSRAGIVHRLDKDTSGVMVIAKSLKALVSLAEQFAQHSQKRVYNALIQGIPKKKSDFINTWHGRCPYNRIKYAVVSEKNGKYAHQRTMKARIKNIH